ncbi:MAG: hypothetical protein JWM11_6758 [Planctomycetaceae bacterium]|nr:hypothetical protein [Planctomycetaceae bacterium]
MARKLWVLFLVGGLFSFGIAAEETPKPVPTDPVAAELSKAKDEYFFAVEKAKERLLAAFAVEQKKLTESKKLKVDQQITLIEQLAEEKKAFESDPSQLPKLPGMKSAATDYQTKTAAAKKKCDEAFVKAAQNYRGKKDFTAAKAVLAELDEFKKNSQPGAMSSSELGTLTLLEGRVNLSKAITNNSWTYPAEGTSTISFKADGTGEFSTGNQVFVWVALDQSRVILYWPSGDFDVLAFTADRKTLVKDWLGKPSGKGDFSGKRIDKK